MKLFPMTVMLGLTSSALAQSGAGMDYVTEPALCPLDYIDRSERGMTFTGSEFFEIEYFCDMKEAFPVGQGGDITHTSIGYCEAPGEVFPTTFVLRSFASEPGVIYVYEPENTEGTAFFNCRP